MLLLYGHFCGHNGLNGNEAKNKMKHPSDIAWHGFEPRCYTYVANYTTIYTLTAPELDEFYTLYCVTLLFSSLGAL